jgi:hypothetical protein
MEATDARAVRCAIVVPTLLLMSIMSVFSCCTQAQQIETAIGEVVETTGRVEVKRGDQDIIALEAGDLVSIGDVMIIQLGSTLLLAMADETVRRFDGPATIEIKETSQDTGGSVLASLTSGVADLLFAGKREMSEAAMVTRAAETEGQTRYILPMLISPSPGSRLIDIPAELRWSRIMGVPLYRVSLYSSDRILWQGSTSDSRIRLPQETCELSPGETYYWVVEALLGNSSLRSQTAAFTVLDHGATAKIRAALSEIDSTCSDSELATLLKARLCLDWDLRNQALAVVNSHYKDEKLDRRGYSLRGQIHEAMGFIDEAMRDYKLALSSDSTE